MNDWNNKDKDPWEIDDEKPTGTPDTPQDPGASAPDTSAPGSSEPDTSEPGASAPGSSEPGASAPGASEPGAPEPGSSEPGASAPESPAGSAGNPQNGSNGTNGYNNPQDAPNGYNNPQDAPNGYNNPQGGPYGTNGYNNPQGGPYGANGYNNPQGGPYGTNGYNNPQGGPYGTNGYNNPQGGPYGTNGYSNPQGGPYGTNGYSNPQGGPYGTNGYSNPQGGPYGTNGNNGPQGAPYGTNGNNGGRQNGPYPPYGYSNPYSRQNNGQQPYYYNQNPQPPHKMSGGLKAFLWVLGVITAGLIGMFIYFSVQPDALQRFDSSASSSQSEQSSPQGSPSSEAPSSGSGGTLPKSGSSSSSSSAVIGGVTGDGTNSSFAGITVEKKPSGTAYTATEVYKKVIGSVVSVETTVTSNGETQTAVGTGIIATSDGYILTNAHVVNYSRSYDVKVVMQDKKEYSAKVVGLDKTSDLAVLKINASGLTPAEFGSTDDMEIGEQVLAIGNPGGLSFAGSLTSGIISALDRTIESHSDNGMTYIQTDAAINPGNSGGPLVNMYGQVIGINSNKIVATGYEGMGFSIPISKAKAIIDQLVKSGYVSGRTRLGITASAVSAAQAGLYGVPQGVIIRSIESESGMAAAGAKVGDIITEADGKTITSLDDLANALLGHKPGDTISMKIYTSSQSGQGTTKTIQVKLLEDKGETQK